MKKYIFGILLLTAVFLQSKAQTEKGSKIIGATFNGRSLNNSGERYYSVQFVPQFHYFIANNLAIGGELISTVGKSSYSYWSANALGLGIAPSVRYYFGKAKFKPFVLADIGFAHNNLISRYNNNGVSENSVSTTNTLFSTLGIGVTYFVTKHIGVEALMNYKTAIRLPVDDLKKAHFGNNMNFKIGLQIYFSGKNKREEEK